MLYSRLPNPIAHRVVNFVEVWQKAANRGQRRLETWKTARLIDNIAGAIENYLLNPQKIRLPDAEGYMLEKLCGVFCCCPQ
jgi:hypothetical protein